MRAWAIALALAWTTPAWAQDPPKKSDTGASEEADAAADVKDRGVKKAGAKKAGAKKSGVGRPQMTPEEEARLFDVSRLEDGADSVARIDETLSRQLDQPIETMARPELEAAGFDFGDREGGQLRPMATLMAVVPGTLVHGVGHWYAGDRFTAMGLVGMESLGVGLAMTSAIVPTVLGEELPWLQFARHGFLLGSSMFITSYILDIAGTVQGTDPLIAENTERIEGASLRGAYTLVDLPRLPVRHGGVLDAEIDFGPAYLQGRSFLEYTLAMGVVDATVGARVWRGRQSQTMVFVEGVGEWLYLRGLGRFERLSAGGMIGGSVSLGAFATSLREIAVGLRAGYVHQWYLYPTAQSNADTDINASALEISYDTGSVPFEAFLHFNLSNRLHMQLSYERRDGAILHDSDRFWGVSKLALQYRLSDRLDLEGEVSVGSGAGYLLGLRGWFWN